MFQLFLSSHLYEEQMCPMRMERELLRLLGAERVSLGVRKAGGNLKAHGRGVCCNSIDQDVYR